MDEDTEVRRLSPIGVKERSGDWIDLLNGPQDHGWCAGYTCQKRISTFWAVLAIGKISPLILNATSFCLLCCIVWCGWKTVFHS